jgi:2-oxoglutarate/2-oxoacid ferredoxin oxidoreductase subunit beta
MIDTKEIKKKLMTKEINTWCPGCPNFLILESVKQTIANLIASGKYKHENFSMTTGIGCHAKIFDYINISGIYGLHGRVLPTCLGMKLGNPNLTVLGFAGDGDTYAEGMAHFIHACRYNADMTLFVHDNQSFSLTTGQATPTSQQGFITKAEPLGEMNRPLNPIKLALAAGATFIARANSRNIKQTATIMEKAIKHKGFSFVEIMQDCLIFNLPSNETDKFMYDIEDNKDKLKAEKIAGEWDYNLQKGKLPVGVIYQGDNIPTLDQEWPQLQNLLKKSVGWKNK